MGESTYKSCFDGGVRCTSLKHVVYAHCSDVTTALFTRSYALRHETGEKAFVQRALDLKIVVIAYIINLVNYNEITV